MKFLQQQNRQREKAWEEEVRTNMSFGDFVDKLPSKRGGTQHMLCTVTQLELQA